MPKQVHIIVNPASGKPQPVLHTLNAVFHPIGVEWQFLRKIKESLEMGTKWGC